MKRSRTVTHHRAHASPVSTALEHAAPRGSTPGTRRSRSYPNRSCGGACSGHEITSADAQIQDIYELRISARMARFSEPESFRWRRGGPFFAPVSISRAICCDPHHSRRLARQAARICAAAWRSHDAFRIRDTLFCRVTCDTCVERCVTRTCVCPQRVRQIACVFSITNRHTHTHESSHTHDKSSHTQQLVGVYVTT